ncbi:MAG: hypothetical protein EXR76_12765 [Myxococcales bacterium]|nr:hypothetical protein [Myxococcales bacterium]
MDARRLSLALLLALQAPVLAHAYHDTSPAIEYSAETLHAQEFRLSLTRVEFGVIDKLHLGTYTLPWLLKVKNARGRYKFYDDEEFAFSADLGLFWLSLSDLESFDDGGGSQDATFVTVPVQLNGTWKLKSSDRLSLGLSYTPIFLSGVSVVGENVDIRGIGATETVALHPSYELRVSRTLAMVLDAHVLVLQRAQLDGAESIQLDKRTRATLYQSAEADLKTGKQANLTLSALWSWEVFNLRIGLGYGHYNLPVAHLFYPTPFVMPEFDFYARF